MATQGRRRREPVAPAPNRRWTERDLQQLRELWGLRTDQEIAKELGRSVESIRRGAQRAFEKKLRKGPWTDTEVDRLREQIGSTPVDAMSKVLGRRADDVRKQIAVLGKERRRGRWTRDELQLLRRLYGTRTDDDLSVALGRPVEAIRRVAKRFALSKDKAFVRRIKGESSTRMPRWGDDELKKLRRLYPNTANLEIAHEVGRSIKSVVSKAHQLGLKKDIERLREMGRENVSARYAGRRG